MAVTYKLIETVTVGSGGTANVEFTSIPQTYTDLVLVHSVRVALSDVASSSIVQFNNDTGANYSSRRLQGDGSIATSTAFSNNALFGLSGAVPAATATTSVFSNGLVYIPNYRSSVAKPFSADSVSETNATNGYLGLFASIWSGTDAITTITLKDYSGTNFVEYSSASLYGIKNS